MRIFAATVCLVVVVALILLLQDSPLAARRNPQTENAYIDGDTTPIAARIQGYLRRVAVNDNQPVRAGDLIAEIEDSDYRAQLAQADAQVAVARAELAALDHRVTATRLQVAQAAAQLDAARAGRLDTDPEARRQTVLAPTDAGLGRAVDTARAMARVTQAGIASAAARADAARSQLDVLAAQQRQAKAALEARLADARLARITLGWTRVRAPVDGVLGPRAVRVGTLVSPDASLVSETPLDTVWVTANFTERQIAGIVPGRPARLRIDAFPHETVAGHVVGLSPGTGGSFSGAVADNTTGNFTKVVQRVPVKIAIDWHGSALRGLLRPGMSLVALVLTEDGAPDAQPLQGAR